MKLKIVFIIATAFLLNSCGDKKSGDGIYFNDYEVLGNWTENHPKLKYGLGKSGLYCGFTDSTVEYTETLRLRIGDVKVEHPKFITATAWVMSNDINSKSQLVISVDSIGKNIAWSANQSEKVIKSPGKWYQIKCTLPLPKQINPDSKVNLFGWANSKERVYYDDMMLVVE